MTAIFFGRSLISAAFESGFFNTEDDVCTQLFGNSQTPWILGRPLPGPEVRAWLDNLSYISARMSEVSRNSVSAFTSEVVYEHGMVPDAIKKLFLSTVRQDIIEHSGVAQSPSASASPPADSASSVSSSVRSP